MRIKIEGSDVDFRLGCMKCKSLDIDANGICKKCHHDMRKVLQIEYRRNPNGQCRNCGQRVSGGKVYCSPPCRIEWRRKHGREFASSYNALLTEDKVEKARALRMQGMTYKQIGIELGCSLYMARNAILGQRESYAISSVDSVNTTAKENSDDLLKKSCCQACAVSESQLSETAEKQASKLKPQKSMLARLHEEKKQHEMATTLLAGMGLLHKLGLVTEKEAIECCIGIGLQKIMLFVDAAIVDSDSIANVFCTGLRREFFREDTNKFDEIRAVRCALNLNNFEDLAREIGNVIKVIKDIVSRSS